MRECDGRLNKAGLEPSCVPEEKYRFLTHLPMNVGNYKLPVTVIIARYLSYLPLFLVKVKQSGYTPWRRLGGGGGIARTHS
jgi:hypothetical protein